MFKKICGTLVAVTFAFGTMFQIGSIFKGLVNACSYVCCDHDGDVWSN